MGLKVFSRSSFLTKSLSVFLSISIFFAGIPQGAFSSKAYAQNVGNEESGEDLKNKSVSQLKDALLGESLVKTHLDPFMLSSQQEIDDRGENLKAYIDQTKVNDFNERVEFYESEIVNLSELLLKLEADKPDEKESGKLEQYKRLLLDISYQLQMRKDQLKDLRSNYNPEKTDGLPVDHMIDEEISKRKYWGNRLRVEVQDDSGKTIETVNQADFKESLSPLFSKDNALKEKTASSFVITIPKRTLRGVLHIPVLKFNVAVESIQFFGSYLVFVEKGAYQAEQGVLPIKFIDLDYFRSAMGNSKLPVFTFPLNLESQPSDIKIERGMLRVNDRSLSYEQFAFLSKTSQGVYNVAVGLVDPATQKSSKLIIEDLMRLFNQSMEKAGANFQAQMEANIKGDQFLASITENLNLATTSEQEVKDLLSQALKDGDISNDELEKIEKEFGKKGLIDQSLKSSNDSVATGRKFFNRIRLLFHHLASPKPQGAPTLFNAMVAVAASDSDIRSQGWKWLKNDPIVKLSTYGVATAGAVLAGTQLPEPYTLHLYQSLDMISAIWEHFQGYLINIDYGKNYVELAKAAAVTSIGGVVYFYSAYLSEGKWAKFLFGLGHVLLVPLMVFSGLHFVVNTFKIFNDVRELGKIEETRDLNFIKRFIKASSNQSSKYWSNLSEAEKQVSGSDVEKMTESDLNVLLNFIERLESGREDTARLKADVVNFLRGKDVSFQKAFSILTTYHNMKKGVKELLGIKEVVQNNLKTKNPETFFEAMKSAFFSYASLYNTFYAAASLWNVWFMTRTFFFSPAKWLMLVIYPNYFRVAVNATKGKQHFPSRFNSGLDSWVDKVNDIIAGSQTVQKIKSNVTNAVGLPDLSSLEPIYTESHVEKMISSNEGLMALEAFENSVLPFEQMAMEVAQRKAFKALLASINNPERIMNIFDSAKRPGQVSTGITSLYDKKLKELSEPELMFFRAFYVRTFDSVMQQILIGATNTTLSTDLDPAEFARVFMQELKSGRISQIDLDANTIKDLEKDVEARIDFSEIRTWSEKMKAESALNLEKININFRHQVIQNLQPSHPQIKRYLTAKNKIKEPRAMERAMRLEVSKLVSGIPVGIMSMLVLYAGVQTGLLMPFDPTGLDTSTHFLYMSRYLFYNGFVPGLILSFLADTWMKVQEDARIDSMKGFDSVPLFKDSKKGFWRFYLKNTFMNPKNKWKDNQIFLMKLLAANIPAAFLTNTIFMAYGLGRFDIGLFLVGYIMIFCTAFTGLNQKISQGFELASTWVYDRIPRHLRAHPEAQKYINSKIQGSKIKFNLFDNLYSIIIHENIAGSMFTKSDHPKIGTRAFTRLIFGGKDPTEILVNFVDALVSSIKSLPGAQTTGDFIKYIFSNNFEAFERFPKRLTDTPPELFTPKSQSTVAAFLGKLGGIVSTWGSFTAAPYVISDALQRRREKKIQQAGKSAIVIKEKNKVTSDEAKDSGSNLLVTDCMRLFL